MLDKKNSPKRAGEPGAPAVAVRRRTPCQGRYGEAEGVRCGGYNDEGG